MTRESNLWSAFKDALPNDAHAVRIENDVELGTPDVNLQMPLSKFVVYVDGVETQFPGWGGWIELKVQRAPVRASTKFRCEHFTMEQKQWLVDRCRASGHAYMLLQIIVPDKDSDRTLYLWLRGDVAAVWVDHCTTSELIEKAEWCGQHLSELVEYLQR